MNSLAFPLRTNRLSLRPHTENDAGWLHNVYSRHDVALYLLDEPWTAEVALKKTSERIPKTDLDGEHGALALVIDHQLTPVGDVLLWFTDRERRVAEIGWVLDPNYGGKGFATEAVRAVLDVAFDHYRVHRVSAQMDGRNTSSAKLAANAGMRHEAHLRQYWWSKGEWADTVIYGMLGNDHAQSRSVQ